jgi:5-methylcytosine-specific restriction endonuclease McrA
MVNPLRKRGKREKQKRKTPIPKGLREQVWRTYNGTNGVAKCFVTWCTNRVTTFDYEVGHNVPESKGGATDIANLRPICGRCNRSMGNTYTIDQWNAMSALPSVPVVSCCVCF